MGGRFARRLRRRTRKRGLVRRARLTPRAGPSSAFGLEVAVRQVEARWRHESMRPPPKHSKAPPLRGPSNRPRHEIHFVNTKTHERPPLVLASANWISRRLLLPPIRPVSSPFPHSLRSAPPLQMPRAARCAAQAPDEVFVFGARGAPRSVPLPRIAGRD